METRPKRGPRVTLPAAPEVPAAEAAPEAPPAPAAELAAAALPVPLPPAPPQDALAALVESQRAVARGLGDLNAELAALTRGGIAAASRSAGDMLTAKTLGEAIAINARLARSNFDVLIGGSSRLSEIGARLAAEATRPLLRHLLRDRAAAAG